MINARELRIGNIILIGGVQAIVEGIDEAGINPSWQSDGMDYDCYFGVSIFNRIDFSGISIADEWLLKFGFRKIKFKAKTEREFWQLGYAPECSFELSSIFQDTNNINCCVLRDTGFSVFINYVHQLQNLYYTLTGQELTYTP